jgi:DNA-directed RNA polymerase subunit N
MIIPVRCFTCGRIVASDYEAFNERTKKGEQPRKVLDELGVERYCCPRMILGHEDLLRESAAYE